MKKRKLKIENKNTCYICKSEIGREFYLLDRKKICVDCYNKKYIASDIKTKAKRIFV